MIHPFTINIPDEVLTDLKQRLAATRWTNEIDNDDWQRGTNLAYLKELCAHWQSGFDLAGAGSKNQCLGPVYH
jgi:microsomal epoxide hydrolase